MDIATILGFLVGWGLVLFSIASGVGLGPFIDVPSLLIVLGGTVGASMINFPLGQITGAGKVLGKTISYNLPEVQKTIEQMVDFSNRARREGILALEEAVNDTDNPFLKKGIQLAVDGEDPGVIESLLDTEIKWLKTRHALGAEVFATMAGFAPAMGLIGTLIGLVGMLQNMDDPSSIGPSMAVALLTTFYGALFANLIFGPISGKLAVRSREEVRLWELTREGVLAISAGDNPRMVEQKLYIYLAPHERKSDDDKG
jgi:chemotaxis protein MotA